MKIQAKIRLIISSIIILLPILFGVVMWKKLPTQMPIHFGTNGEPDGWVPTTVAVTLLPLVLLAMHLSGIYFFRYDQSQNKKAMQIAYWLIPLLSLFINTLMYGTVLGYKINSKTIVFPVLFLAIIFIWIGNYLPKIAPNRRLGIKLPWTLADEDNWIATHRFGGKFSVILGIITLFFVFLPTDVIAIAIFLEMLIYYLVLTIYSYLYYKKQSK